MDIIFPVCIIGIGVIFCVTQFCHLMRRPDSEFPGRFDKLIWAFAILLANVFGAFAYWLSKSIAPKSNRPLRQEQLAALEHLGASDPESAG